MKKLTDIIREYYDLPGSPPLRLKELGQALRIKKSQKLPFLEALGELLLAGYLVKTPSGVLTKPGSESGALVGTVRRSSNGNATFTSKRVATEGELALTEIEELVVFSEDLAGALTGDTVVVQPLRKRLPGGKKTGKVVEILERATNRFVGVYQERAGQGFVMVDGGLFTRQVPVGDPGAKGAKPEDKVVIELIDFPEGFNAGEGVITKVLGPRGEPAVETLSIIYQFGLPDEFPEAVLQEASLVAAQFDQTAKNGMEAGRVDLTGETIITIDPADARDFDDAISLTRDEEGRWRLGVHIADVAYFVKPGTQLDREAKVRGNSVYLPQRVLPMLPEVISNGLASLQEARLRFTKTAFITFAPNGMVLGSDFANTAISTAKRFAYEQVMPIVRDEPDAIEVTPAVRTLLKDMYTLAMLLRKRRFARGALELDMPEIRLTFGADGKANGAARAHHDESHEVIEEFMLAANVAVATALNDRSVAFLRRAHPSPDEKKLDALGDFARSLGYKLKRCQSRQELQKLLADAQGRPTQSALTFALLRSLKQASYTAEEIGHYALAEEHYTHFTSPIRRYPDLTIHRQLNDLIEGRAPNPPGDLESTGKECSFTERRAEQAERELIKLNLLRYLLDRPGLVLEVLVTGVERYGLFCTGVELPADGLLPLVELPSDHYDHDAVTHTLVGRRKGRLFRLGDRLTVQVGKIDLTLRRLDFRWYRVPAAGVTANTAANVEGNPTEGGPDGGDGATDGSPPSGREQEWAAPKKPRSFRRGRSKADVASRVKNTGPSKRRPKKK